MQNGGEIMKLENDDREVACPLKEKKMLKIIKANEKDGVYFPVYVKATLPVCIESNNERRNPIPNEKIKEINKKLDIPGIRYT